MPLPENFIDGQVLDAADVNDITETVNEIDVRVDNLERIQFNQQFGAGSEYSLALSDSGKIVEVGGSTIAQINFKANEDVLFPVGTQITIINVRSVDITLNANNNVFFNTVDGFALTEIDVKAGGIVTCIVQPINSQVVSNWYVTGNIV